MATITPPYVDPGLAAFEVLDTYVASYLLAGQHPQLSIAYGFDLPNSVDYDQFSVVGLNADKKLVMATYGVAAAAATGTLTFSGVGTADDTVTIAGVVYTLKAAAAAAYQVTIGASATLTAANLVAAINGTGFTGTLPHPDVSAANAAGVITLTARQLGDDGNEVTTTEAGSSSAFGAATLTGGRDQGGVAPIGVLAHAAALGASGTGKGQVWYTGCFNQTALVWDASFDTDAKKQGAFMQAGASITDIIVAKRN